MKVLIVVDKIGSAIERLAQMVKKHAPYHDIQILPVHPKRNDSEALFEASQLLQWADIIDIHYWKSGDVLMSTFANQMKKPKILFHFNPYDITKADWLTMYDEVIVGNQEIQNKIPYAGLIGYGVDLDVFKYNNNYVPKDNKVVMMSVARIEGKKGVLTVAKACKELGYTLKLIGRVSSAEYMQEVLNTGVVQFTENASDDELVKAYYDSALVVCNSIDNFESGTLPILEAMACGVPVLTRNIGHVPDLYNGKNMMVRLGAEDDLEDLKKSLKEIMENYEWREGLRDRAWDTARTRDSRMMVLEILKHYNKLYIPDRKLVSVIMPTKDNPEVFMESLVHLAEQDYKKYEVIVVDSGETPVKAIVEAFKAKVSFPVKYVWFDGGGRYTLAEARNRGVLEAEGEILVFCDERLGMNSDAITKFVEVSKERAWLWGSKDGVIKGFVENFSSVRRADLVAGGLFNERIDTYGGMTQEIRTRFEIKRGFEFILVDGAKCISVKRAKSKNSRRETIRQAKFLIYKLFRQGA